MTASPALPALPDSFVAALQAAQDGGQAAPLEIDEAEWLAVGGPVSSRAGRPAFAPDVAQLRAAGERLVARGLATSVAWGAGEFTPAGPLLGHLSMVLHPKAHVGTVATWLDPEPAEAQREQWRVTLLIDVVRGGIAVVEHTGVPVPDQPQPLPVQLELVRLDVLVQRLLAAVYAPPPGGAAGERGVGIVFAAGAEPVTTRVAVDLAAGTARLLTPPRRRFGARETWSDVTPDQLADHLRNRLLAAS